MTGQINLSELHFMCLLGGLPLIPTAQDWTWIEEYNICNVLECSLFIAISQNLSSSPSSIPCLSSPIPSPSPPHLPFSKLDFQYVLVIVYLHFFFFFAALEWNPGPLHARQALSYAPCWSLCKLSALQRSSVSILSEVALLSLSLTPLLSS